MDLSATPCCASTSTSWLSHPSHASPVSPTPASIHTASATPSPIPSYQGEDHGDDLYAPESFPLMPTYPYALPLLTPLSYPLTDSHAAFVTHAETIFHSAIPTLLHPSDSISWAQAAHNLTITLHNSIPSSFEPPPFGMQHDLLHALYHLIGALDPHNTFASLSHFGASCPSSPTLQQPPPLPSLLPPPPAASIQDMLLWLEVNLTAQSHAHLTALQDTLTDHIAHLEAHVLLPTPGPLPHTTPAHWADDPDLLELCPDSPDSDSPPVYPLSPGCSHGVSGLRHLHPLAAHPPPFSRHTMQECSHAQWATATASAPTAAPSSAPAPPVGLPSTPPPWSPPLAQLYPPTPLPSPLFCLQPLPHPLLPRLSLPPSLCPRLSQWPQPIPPLPSYARNSSVTAILPILCMALWVPLTHPLTITQDIKWAKVILGHVITHDSPSDPLFTDAQLLDGLSVNPHFNTLCLTQLPRWLR
ncbi:hypothetical protein M0805_004098 [Coniferiporia weirii]|nr:hypothetical protein M0805_004098 [Coniferiporia weirii]